MFDAYALAAIASFIRVFLKSWQQLSVQAMQFKTIMPVSVLMSASEVYVIFSVKDASQLWALVLVMGVAAGLGSMLSMWLHSRLNGRGR
jgi:membrane protein YqaA with SNARE-associated domain